MTDHLPPIVVSEGDYDTLSELAERTERALPKVSSFLAAELARAKVVPAARVPADVVRMGSRAAFRMEATGVEREVTLVYPAEADILQDRLSILTPVGTALLGLAAGQSMSWSDRTGNRQRLTLRTVRAAAVG